MLESTSKSRTPEEIYDYMHEEFTPYASIKNREEAKKHIVDMIKRYAHNYYFDKLAEFGGHLE